MLPLFLCFVLFAILLTVAKSQVFADGIMGIVDFLVSTAGLQIDLDADVINGHSLQAQTDDFGVAGILLVEVSQKLDLQFLFGRFRAKLVQNLILYGLAATYFDVKGFTVIFVIERQDFHRFGL